MIVTAASRRLSRSVSASLVVPKYTSRNATASGTMKLALCSRRQPSVAVRVPDVMLINWMIGR